ncbi:MAG: VOC family protein [Candidatus Helarchaeota archaeon]|nr:VOC family protein [Candidatus Helarchaeota archaeon]
MENNAKMDLRNLRVDQFGYVYKDVEKQAQIMESLFNMPKFNFLPPMTGRVTYRGKDTEYTVKLGFTRYFNLQMELIQPIKGESIHKEFLDQGREGLHHVSCSVKNVESYIDYLKELGLEVVFSGLVPGRRLFAYFDTEATLGIMLEIQGTLKRRKKQK